MPPSILGRERDGDTDPQKKDYIIDRKNRLNAPGYIARAWAHYNTFRGAPFPRQMSQSEGNCTNQSPNQTPMRPGRCHSCARQRHPDTMYNITPPIKERLPSDAQKMVKNPRENKISKPSKSWPCTNQGLNYHSGCGPSAQPIGPSTQVRRAERDYPPPHVGPQQALVLQPQMSLWPPTPKATINPSFSFFCFGVSTDLRL